MKKRDPRAQPFGMEIVYWKKRDSYEKLTQHIRSHKDYSPNNEWGSHEILSLFHEVVLAAKLSIANCTGNKVHSHQEIAEQLFEIGKDLKVLYIRMRNIARMIRYEYIEPVINGKNYQAEFKGLYKEFMNRIPL